MTGSPVYETTHDTPPDRPWPPPLGYGASSLAECCAQPIGQ